MMDALLQVLPPWLVIVPLIGLINAALFFVIAGRRSIGLPLYAFVAIAAATAVQSFGIARAGEPPLSLGEVNLVATSVGAWVSLVVIRWIGL
jgi:hypothetical protein